MATSKTISCTESLRNSFNFALKGVRNVNEKKSVWFSLTLCSIVNLLAANNIYSQH